MKTGYHYHRALSLTAELNGTGPAAEQDKQWAEGMHGASEGHGTGKGSQGAVVKRRWNGRQGSIAGGRQGVRWDGRQGSIHPILIFFSIQGVKSKFVCKIISR